MWECDYHKQALDVRAKLESVDQKYLPPLTREGPRLNKDTFLEAVRDDTFFGVVECDIHAGKLNKIHKYTY